MGSDCDRPKRIADVPPVYQIGIAAEVTTNASVCGIGRSVGLVDGIFLVPLQGDTRGPA